MRVFIVLEYHQHQRGKSIKQGGGSGYGFFSLGSRSGICKGFDPDMVPVLSERSDLDYFYRIVSGSRSDMDLKPGYKLVLYRVIQKMPDQNRISGYQKHSTISYPAETDQTRTKIDIR